MCVASERCITCAKGLVGFLMLCLFVKIDKMYKKRTNDLFFIYYIYHICDIYHYYYYNLQYILQDIYKILCVCLEVNTLLLEANLPYPERKSILFMRASRVIVKNSFMFYVNVLCVVCLCVPLHIRRFLTFICVFIMFKHFL